MTAIDIAEFVGICLGCWSAGYAAGFGILSIRKFAEQV